MLSIGNSIWHKRCDQRWPRSVFDPQNMVYKRLVLDEWAGILTELGVWQRDDYRQTTELNSDTAENVGWVDRFYFYFFNLLDYLYAVEPSTSAFYYIALPGDSAVPRFLAVLSEKKLKVPEWSILTALWQLSIKELVFIEVSTIL